MKMYEEKVKRALDARLASLSASPERRARIRAAALKEEERTMKRKWTVGVALAAVLVLSLTGAALAISGNLFELFAQRDARYQGVADQAAVVTEAPARIEDAALGTVRAYVDSAYYDGQSLTLTIAVENARRAVAWTPSSEELAQMTQGELLPSPVTEEERLLLEAYLADMAAGKPCGMRWDSLWVHDQFYTPDGVALAPSAGDEETGEQGETYELRAFSPLPEAAVEQESLSVYAELGRSTIYFYFDGQKAYSRSEVQREGVGRVTATIPRAAAEIARFTGTGALNGAECAVSAQVSALEMTLTITAEQAVFPLETRNTAGQAWQEQPWLAEVYDENGQAYRLRGSSEVLAENQLCFSFDGLGYVPQTLRVCVYRDGEEPQPEPCVEIRKEK